MALITFIVITLRENKAEYIVVRAKDKYVNEVTYLQFEDFP